MGAAKDFVGAIVIMSSFYGSLIYCTAWNENTSLSQLDLNIMRVYFADSPLLMLAASIFTLGVDGKIEQQIVSLHIHV